MGNQFGLWQGVAYNLAMRFAKHGKAMVESGAHDGGPVVIDFLTLSVTPYVVAYRRESYVALCRYFLKDMEKQYGNQLLAAQMKVEQNKAGKTYYEVRLETLDPPVWVNGLLVNVGGTTFEWDSKPKASRRKMT